MALSFRVPRHVPQYWLVLLTIAPDEQLPHPKELKAAWSTWLKALHPGESARMRRWARTKGKLDIGVAPRDAVMPLMLLDTPAIGDDERTRFDEWTHGVRIAVRNPTGSTDGVLAGLGVARAIAAELDGLVFDVMRMIAHPLSDRNEPLPEFVLDDYFGVLMAPGLDGIAMSTVGLGRFGIPELQINDVDYGAAIATMHGVDAVAWSLIRKTIPSAGKRIDVDVVEVTSEDAAAAMNMAPTCHESLQVELSFVEPDPGLVFARIHEPGRPQNREFADELARIGIEWMGIVPELDEELPAA